MGLLKIRLSNEEREEVKSEILRMIPDGTNNAQMAENLGLDSKTIDYYIKELIAEKRTSQDIIDAAREAKLTRERNEKKRKVLYAIMAGKTRAETKAMAKIDTPLLDELTNELIEERNNRRRISRSKKKRSK